MEGASNRVVVLKDNEITDFDIEEGLTMQKDLNECLFQVSKAVSI